MKKILLRILLGILVCAVVYLMWLPSQKPTPLRLQEGVYVGEHFNGERPYQYILEVRSPIDLSIYQYYVDSDDNIIGKRVDYTFSGKNYNHLFWNFYVYPESSVLFWNNIRYFDDYLDHARIRMESGKTYVLNSSSRAEYGGYTDEVVLLGDTIRIGPIGFGLPDYEEDKEQAEQVIKAFAEKGREIKP